MPTSLSGDPSPGRLQLRQRNGEHDKTYHELTSIRQPLTLLRGDLHPSL